MAGGYPVIMPPGACVAFGGVTIEQQLRKRAAERSRRAGYRAERPQVQVLGDNGCRHIPAATGFCLRCGERVDGAVLGNDGEWVKRA